MGVYLVCKRRDYNAKMASNVKRRQIYTNKVAKSPYLSQAIQVDNLLILSGCLGFDVARGQMVTGGAEAEAHMTLQNMSRVLEAANSSLKNVVKVNVYLRDMEDYEAVNKVYMEYFSHEPRPGRTCVQVVSLPKGAAVEMEATAVVGRITDIKAKL